MNKRTEWFISTPTLSFSGTLQPVGSASSAPALELSIELLTASFVTLQGGAEYIGSSLSSSALLTELRAANRSNGSSSDPLRPIIWQQMVPVAVNESMNGQMITQVLNYTLSNSLTVYNTSVEATFNFYKTFAGVQLESV